MSVHRCCRSVVFFVALLWAGGPCVSVAHAQPRAGSGAIDGFVSDTNLIALANATVSVLGSGVRVTTGENGRFRITSMPSGSYLLVVQRLGYVPVSASVQLGVNDTLRTSFTLSRITNVLDTVITTAKRLSDRMSEFDARRIAGIGRFLTQVDIEKRQPVVFSDLLRAIPSVAVMPGRMFADYAVSLRSGGCPMTVFVDNVRMPTPTNLLDLPSPKDIAGIEIYAGPSEIPIQYQTMGARCGLILIWTRDGG